jgi:L-amino acid N-acyltransferase YncA
VPAPLTVRAATPADAEAIRAIYAPVVEHTAISFEQHVPTVEEMRARMTAGPTRLPWLVASPSGSPDEVAGYAYAAAHRSRAAYRWSVETSVYVAETARGLGVGRMLYAALLPVLTRLGYVSAYAGVALPNPASVALHESAGFRHIGTFPRVGHKHGRWHDTGWWWLPLDQAAAPDGEPPAPRAWDGTDPG